ncbi:methylenetetrahydrofolate reductase [NAD(P)H] [Fibrobacter sp.]|uniref:methylenetetrahydrofolate reductase [NAD(P)H] n=1 Tax=Fibrobacter sp. TaxID=35828 RepID=UPI00388E7B9F
MKIIDIIRSPKPTLSFEVFPPKTSQNFESVRMAIEEIAELEPDFMSVTYGAGGGTSDFTADIAAGIQDKYGVPALAHMTCVSSPRAQVRRVTDTLKDKGITTVLALRGDIPEGFDLSTANYRYASELIREIKERGDFCIGGACYPEAHPESKDSFADLAHLKEKADSGCEFFTTQMFFDNAILYNFIYRARAAGISVPIVAGIMPVTNAAQIKRIMAISGSALPQRFVRIVDRYGSDPAAMMQAGIAYATAQIIDLFANGVPAVHVYSMNKPDVAEGILKNVSAILGKNFA